MRNNIGHWKILNIQQNMPSFMFLRITTFINIYHTSISHDVTQMLPLPVLNRKYISSHDANEKDIHGNFRLSWNQCMYANCSFILQCTYVQKAHSIFYQFRNKSLNYCECYINALVSVRLRIILHILSAVLQNKIR